MDRELHDFEKDPRYQELCTRQIDDIVQLSVTHALQRIDLQEEIQAELNT